MKELENLTIEEASAYLDVLKARARRLGRSIREKIDVGKKKKHNHLAIRKKKRDKQKESRRRNR